MSNPETAVSPWASLADLEEGDRERQMEGRYKELFALDEDERRGHMRSMAEAEYALEDETIRPFHLSRLRVWLLMDPEIIRTIGASYDAVLDQMPGEVAMRRVGLAQSLLKAFSLAEQEQLRSVLPRIFGDRGTATSSWRPSTAAGFSSRPIAKKPWWAFWA